MASSGGYFRKMKIGIAYLISGSYFSGSINVAALGAAELFEHLGHTVELVHLGNESEPWYDDVAGLKGRWKVRRLADALSAANAADVHPYNLLIDMVGVMTTADRKKLADAAVFFARDHGCLREIDACVYPAHTLRRNLEGLAEIWIWDTLSADDAAMWQTLSHGTPCRRLPFFWSATPLATYLADAKLPASWNATAGAVSATSPWNIHICESNIRNSSSAIVPFVIAGQVKRAASANIESIIIHNGEGLKDNKYFMENIYKNGSTLGLGYAFVGRQRCCDWILHPRTAVLAHSRFIRGKYAYLDCAYMGIPIIHNSVMLKELGGVYEQLYYRDNSISGAVDAFSNLQQLWDKGWTAEAPRQKLEEMFGFKRSAVCDAWAAATAAALPVSQALSAVAPLPSANTNCNNRSFNICFAYMWENYQASYNFFTLLLTAALGSSATICGLTLDECKTRQLTPDLIIMGPFTQSVEDFNIYPGVPKVFQTSEQLPGVVKHDDIFLYLDFQGPTPENPIALRLPLWIMSIDWFGADNDRLVNPRLIPLNRCCRSPSNSLLEKKEKFCAFIVSNPMNEARNAAFHTLNAYKPVDSAGRLFNNIGPAIFAGLGGGGGEHKKLAFLEDYKFSITYENQRGPGYITEKLLHAKAAGCVPIYWGGGVSQLQWQDKYGSSSSQSQDVAQDFSPAGFLDANQLSGEALIAAVRDVENGRWATMAAEPAITQEKVDEIRKLLSQIAGRIIAKLSPSLVSLIPQQLGCSYEACGNWDSHISKSTNIPMAAPPTNNMEISTTTAFAPAHLTADTSVCFATYASNRFIPSLEKWLNAVQRHRKTFNKSRVFIAIAADISADTLGSLATKYADVVFERVPTAAPADFPDFWESQHFGWKTWIWYHLATTLTDHIVFYSDAGSVMIRIPEEAATIALKAGVCIYEDKTQLNKYWCQESFCKELCTTPEELEMYQPIAGAITFRSGSELAIKLFETVWQFAQKRHILAGPKWAGQLPSGQPYGHRHDQSILSIIARRQGAPWRDMRLDFNDFTLRRAFLNGCSYYFHRGDFIPNKPFLGKITDAYVINLERRVDRLERFRKEQTSFAKRVETWKAVDGRNLILTPAIARLFRPNDFFWKKAVMGCAASHLGLWHQLAAEPGDQISYLIFEDDARCHPDFESILARAMITAPEDYDVLYLGGVLPPNREMFKHVTEPVQSGSPWCRVAPNQIFGQRQPTRYFHFCAYGYVLSQKGARKLMSLIAARDGYYTSADHMMCNQVDTFNLYFLKDQPVGCTQEDDERYMTSDFNNFSRIDGFDSDLWTNDERFSETERLIALDGDIKLDVANALADIRNQMVSSAAQPEQRQIAAQIADNRCRFFYYSPDKTPQSFKNVMEADWLSELLGIDLQLQNLQNIADLPASSRFCQPPICLVQRPHLQSWQILFEKWQIEKQPFYAIHLSDEFSTDDIHWYTYSNCKGVLRNYLRADLSSAPHILTVPLGYASGRSSSCESSASATRKYQWSFEGTAWFDRATKLQPLIAVTDNYVCNLRPDWNANKYDSAAYNELLDSTCIIPCPPGINNETFRFYEALEHGCVPLYARRASDELYWSWIEKHLPIHASPNWETAGEIMKLLLGNMQIFEMYRAKVADAWIAWKAELKTAVRGVFADAVKDCIIGARHQY